MGLQVCVGVGAGFLSPQKLRLSRAENLARSLAFARHALALKEGVALPIPPSWVRSLSTIDSRQRQSLGSSLFFPLFGHEIARVQLCEVEVAAFPRWLAGTTTNKGESTREGEPREARTVAEPGKRRAHAIL